MIKSEWNKIRRCLIPFLIIMLVPIIINGLLAFDLHFRYSYLLAQKNEIGFSYWQLIFKEQNIFMINHLISLFAVMYVYLNFSVETKFNAWLNIKLFHVSNKRILIGKFILTVCFMLVLIFLGCITIIPVGRYTGVTTAVEWQLFGVVFLTQMMSAVATIAIGFLILAVVPKIVHLIIVSCFLFLFSSILQNTNEEALVLLNPFSFATFCYTQTWEDVFMHFIVASVWVVICLFTSIIILSKREELG